jgi:hypothetical protein
MNRNELQKISRLRVKEAKVLLDNGYAPGAYCLMGYAVECVLKACIAKKTKRYDCPDHKQVQVASYSCVPRCGEGGAAKELWENRVCTRSNP